MGVEPERKFLLKDDSWKKDAARSYPIVQAYLSKDPERTVRVRITDDEAFITIKGQAPKGTIDTPEFEYEIPISDARELLKICLPGAISKTRHEVEHGGKTWEIDVFDDANKGLVLAEIELTHGAESFVLPPWAGTEVTHDMRYKNTYLSQNPYTTWPAGDSPGKKFTFL